MSKRHKPKGQARPPIKEGKRLLRYPESYTGPRPRVTRIHKGRERYVYNDGTLDLGSTVLTKEMDRFHREKTKKGGEEKPVWVKVSEGREIPRMPLGEFIRIVEELPSTPETEAILKTLKPDRGLGNGEGRQGAGELYGLYGPDLDDFLNLTDGGDPSDRPTPIAYQPSSTSSGAPGKKVS